MLTIVVAAYFGGRVSMRPAIAKRDQIIQENARKHEQLERESQALMDQLYTAFKSANERGPETEFEEYLRRHSAGNGQFFLGPIPNAK
jgi:hypothetical protein